MRSKRLMALTMAVVLSVSTLSVPAKAQETTQEYVVQTVDENALAEVIEENESEVVEESSVEELEEQQMTVLELTEKEAEKLSEEKDVLVVEENIILEASTEASGDVIDDDTIDDVTTEVSTEFSADEDKNIVKDKTKKDKKNNNKKTKNQEQKKEKTKTEKKGLSNEERRRKIESKKSEGNNETDLQWNLKAIHLPEDNVGNEKIKVALIDSGASYDEDVPIADRIAMVDGEVVDNALFDDATGHGTGLASLIVAQDDGNGIKGINPNAEIYSIQVLDENNQTTLSNLIAAIYKAIELDCKIINLSLGTNVDSEMLHAAIRDAYDAGILIVAAAGNKKGQEVQYPAAYEEVLAVGSTDATGNKVVDSCDGEEIEIFAPGSQIPTTGLFGGISIVEGTSAATAQVTGAASLIWSMDLSKSAGFVRSLLTNTTQFVEDRGGSEAGLLDISNAVEQYDVLSKIYVDNKCEYTSIQHDSVEAEEYTDIDLVNGMWGGTQHSTMVSNAITYNVSNNYIRLMQTTARLADAEKYKDASYLHGSHNYVKGLKFLYQCAEYLRDGKGIENALDKAASDAKLNLNKNNDKLLVEKTRLLLKTNVLSGVDDLSNKNARYYKVLGFAMHLVGDVYAHRTIVPKYTVKGTNPSSYRGSTNAYSFDAKFGSSDFKSQSHSVQSDSQLKNWAKKPSDYSNICKQWKCFEKTVNLGVMEFRDIKYYTTNSTLSKYEDNPNFCKERYTDAEFMCEILFDESYCHQTFDGIFILYPTGDNVKLNYLRGYAKNIGEDISFFTAEEWKMFSTLEEY
ncbi:MAG: S8 family serine peptidase [Lachnospiraceae bacterium]|nr:S8 family serine peptidase [Lachnospiraceae bacterium]